MRMNSVVKAIALVMLVVMLATVSGCAQTMQAIEHRSLNVGVKMSDTIFIDPVSLSKNRNVYVKVTNTSDMQEFDFYNLLKENLAQKGLTVVNDASSAGFIIQANVLYMDYAKQGLTGDGMLAGGFGGLLAGASLGGTSRDAAALGLIGGALGAVGGGLIGSMFKVEEYIGAIDVQIQERVEGGVRGKMITDAKQGTATQLHTEREVKSDYQIYRTRIVAKAKQTNMDKMEAARIISDRLAKQIAGMF